MKVATLFIDEKITFEVVENSLKAAEEDEDDYWFSALQFISDKWDTCLTTMSAKQFNWVHKILEDLVEKRIERRR